MEFTDCLLKYKSLLSKSYIENSSLEAEEITREELIVLEELEPDEVFDNLQDLLFSLLAFKRSVRYSDHGELLQAVKNYEINLKNFEVELSAVLTENKNLSKTIQENQKKEEEFHSKILELTLKVQDMEKEIKLKDRKIKHLQFSKIESTRKNKSSKTSQADNSREAIRLPEEEDLVIQSQGYNTPHKSIISYMKFDSSLPNGSKKQTIKSVKFEYFIANNKPIDRTINMKTDKKNPSAYPTRHASMRSKPVHARSASLVFSSPDKHA